MKVLSDENTAIQELKLEAEKRRKQIQMSGIQMSGSQEGNEGTSRDSLGSTLSNFILNSAKESFLDNKKNGMGSVSYALLEFLNSLKDNKLYSNPNSITDSKVEYSKKVSLDRTLDDFLSKSSKGETDKDSSLADDSTLGAFLDSTKSKKIKSIRNIVNISELVNNISKDDVFDVKQLKNFLENLKNVSRGELLNIYESLLKMLDIHSNKIKGLDVFLASSAFLSKPQLQKIDIQSEIIRTNFSLTPERFWEKEELQDSNSYINLDESLINLPKVAKLMESIKYIKRISNPNEIDRPKGKRGSLYSNNEVNRLKVVDKTRKDYYIPNWAYASNRKSLEMRVKQLNRLSSMTSKSPLNGIEPKENDFIKSLNSLLKFASTGEVDEKDGFFQGGMAMDELSQMRKKMSTADINKDNFHSNADNKIMEFDRNGFVTYNIGTLGNPLVLPSIDLGNFNISMRPLSTRVRNGMYGDTNPNRDAFYHKVYNTSIEALLRKAPDFRQNMYHGIFVYTSPDGIGKIQEFNELTTSVNGYNNDNSIGFKKTGQNDSLITQLSEAYENVLKTYYVRMQGITIPGANVEPYSIPFLNRNIKKVGNNFTENHKIHIEFTVDEMGLIIRSFNILTGQFGYIKDETAHNKYAETIFPVNFSPENKGRLDLVVTYNDFRINPNFKDEDIPSKSNFMPATQNLQSENDVVESRNGKQVFGDQRAYRQFILEDVKILGLSGKVQFKRDDAGKMTVPVDIMFRRITTVDNNLMR